LQRSLLIFAIVAGLLSGLNLFMHKIAASHLEKTELGGVFRIPYLVSLARNPYVYVVLAMGLLVLAIDLAFLSNEVEAIVGLNLVIVIGNVLFAVLCVAVLRERMDLRVAAGIGFGVLAMILLSRV
jgi:hypothetical protein